ncbi:nitrate reductase [Catalinimonas niigatensis]|uniref:nitrate reductase n=1 Tax=Catalinimonas niigatensis TaxID=1397264 RepID=UPI0026652CAB|nr:nitrate reductase [Catalinimonas niigatensis]WPP52865.1 molybdopterin-dependent oxidoreductase [Catalinimonas niigatensis]
MKQTSTSRTTCSYCGVGCGILVNKDRQGKVTVAGDPDHPVNKGMLCSKGMNLHYVAEDRSDRLLHPQMRWSRSAPMQKVSWDRALDRAAAVFKSLIRNYGPDSVGFYVSGQCLTEEYYLVNKLTKGFLGTNNVDTNSRLCMSSAVAGYAKTLGEDAVPICYDDIEQADCFFIAGANPAWCHPILFRRIEKHKEQNPDTRIIVVDPRKTQSCALADLHLQIRPGTDTVLYHAIGRCLIEQGDIDLAFIRSHTDGFEVYRKEVMQTTLQEAAAICDVPIDEIMLAAKYIGNAKGFLTLWAMGLNQSASGVNKNLALINLNLITGHIGKPGSGPFSLTGQPNAMGGREVGGMASLLAAHRNLLDANHRQEVADFWGVEQIADKPGLTATQMFDALREGKMKAVWIICTNPLVSLPDARKIEEALQKASFVVVQDISNRSDTVAYADLVLPAAGWLEKEGTMTNSERRISYLEKVIEAPGEALPDAEILIRFAQKMGFHGFDYASMAEVYAEHCALTKGTNIDISGLDYEVLKDKGTMQWPVPQKGHPGTPRLFEDKKFYTPNHRAQIQASGAANLSEAVTPDFPLILTTGRVRDQWHTMTRTGKVQKLRKHISQPFLEIHPQDALARNIKEDDVVVISNSRGEVKVKAKVTEDIKKGVVFLPMHWGKILQKDFGRANNLTNNLYDPVSKEPDFKFSAVQVAKVTKTRQKIVIIGAGAAAYRFINTYRELNQEDEIHVFSKEEYPFYNRVLLPEYINDSLSWQDLMKFKTAEEFAKLNVHLHPSNAIASIDRQQKTVTDADEKEHTYDILVMATGSRAFVPGDVPIHYPGIFTMRSRDNADKLKYYLPNHAHVIIVGGGLLGLELAAALLEMNVKVTIVQLASRLMERQLDHTASALLREKVEEMGIHLQMNDQVQLIEPHEPNQPIQARLKSGKSITCHAVVYAIGTRPNIEMARETQLACGRGVQVNDYLQTSDPDIFALGEIAEHREKMLGITAAAEQQADIAARYIAGDPLSMYQGSTPMNILKFSHLDLCSVGIAEIPHHNRHEYEEIIFLDKSRAYYKKCIIHHDRLVGAILMGDKSEFAEFKSLIEEKTELGDTREKLLRSGGPSKVVKGKLVCSCGNVGKGNLEEAITGGAHQLGTLCQATGAGLGCGSCKPELKALIDEHLMIKV